MSFVATRRASDGSFEGTAQIFLPGLSTKSFKNRRDPLSSTYAHTDQAITGTSALHFVHKFNCENIPRGPHRMSQRNGTTVYEGTSYAGTIGLSTGMSAAGGFAVSRSTFRSSAAASKSSNADAWHFTNQSSRGCSASS